MPMRLYVRAFDYNLCNTQEIGDQWSSSLYQRRAHSPWHRLRWYMCVPVFVAVCAAVCTAVLQCLRSRSTDF